MNKPTNQQILTRYLKMFRHSVESVMARRSALKYFTNKFGYKGLFLEIKKRDLIDYHDWLNHNENIGFKTKVFKWNIIMGLVRFLNEYYDDILEKPCIIPKYSIHWKENHKKPDSNKDVILDKKEIEQILQYYKIRNQKYYLIFRILTETGMRRGELVSIKTKNINIEKRYILTIGKMGEKVYYITRKLANLLKDYMEYRETSFEYLFISKYRRKFSVTSINDKLRADLKRMEIEKRISPHSFRRTINTLRKTMGCNSEDRKILLNHKTGDVNLESYVKLKYDEFIELYDKWNPYLDINL